MNAQTSSLTKIAIFSAMMAGATLLGHAQVVVNGQALPPDGSGGTTFTTIPNPSSTDLLEGLTPIYFSGTLHSVSGPLSNLTNGVIQTDGNDYNGSGSAGTADNYSVLLSDGTSAALLYNLGSVDTINQINSYSWHAANRAPQVYSVYGATNPTSLTPAVGVDPTTLGYTLIAQVDTNSLTPNANYTDGGALEGASVQNSTPGGSLGNYQYILFDIAPGNSNLSTFYGELDVVGTASVPEPSTYALVFVGFVLLVGINRFRSRSSYMA